ncbi:MAG: rRNA maturation RNase YbeY [Clostridia bacterium]|nr:rRNA maturation RNase YbeY [Clostridia bacterium]
MGGRGAARGGRRSDLRRVARRAVAAALSASGAGHALVELRFAGDRAMRELNRRFRGEDRATDVLSFPCYAPEELPAALAPPPGGPPVLLGAVVVNLAQARRQAAEYGHSPEREVAFLAVHGTLHLLGYDHADEASEAAMMARTEEILSPLGLSR